MREQFFKLLGIEVGKIQELLPSDLPVVQTHDLEVDYLCKLENGTLLHLEFQTTTSEELIDRLMLYDSLINNKWKLPIVTYVIYGAGINDAIDTKNYGSITYQVQNIYIGHRDGDHIFKQLWNKIENGEELTDEEMGNLVLLPLMKSKKSRAEMTMDSAYIASKVKNQEKQNQILAFLLTISINYLNEDETEQLLGVMSMTKLYEKIVEKGYIEGMEKGIEKGIIETAIRMLKEGADIPFVMKVTGLSEQKINELLTSLK